MVLVSVDNYLHPNVVFPEMSNVRVKSPLHSIRLRIQASVVYWFRVRRNSITDRHNSNLSSEDAVSVMTFSITVLRLGAAILATIQFRRRLHRMFFHDSRRKVRHDLWMISAAR